MSLEENPETIVRYELPLSKIIPKRLYEAQLTEEAILADSDLYTMAKPDSIDWRLRIKYNSLLQKWRDPQNLAKDPILQEDIYRDICSYDVWRRRVDIPAKAVFITRRISSYLEDQDALLTAMSARLWEIASMNLSNKDGSVNTEAVKIVHKTIQILLDRKFGMAIQRQVTASISPMAADPLALEAQVMELEEMARGAR